MEIQHNTGHKFTKLPVFILSVLSGAKHLNYTPTIKAL